MADAGYLPIKGGENDGEEESSEKEGNQEESDEKESQEKGYEKESHVSRLHLWYWYNQIPGVVPVAFMREGVCPPSRFYLIHG